METIHINVDKEQLINFDTEYQNKTGKGALTVIWEMLEEQGLTVLSISSGNL